MESTEKHKSGFVNIIGKPNAGKSTLMNALVGERMSIITRKPQTTRHRILGILSGEDFQVVFSDTPGIIDDPAYKMQEAMNRFVHSTFEDADIMLLVLSPDDEYLEDDPLFHRLQQLEVPVFLLINKMDTLEPQQVDELRNWWGERFAFSKMLAISALRKQNTDELLALILQHLPEGPAFYPKDQITDRPERFFVSEIIRESILELYHQEIPYSAEVIVEEFKEGHTRSGEEIVRIRANIFVMRPTQKSILIGKGGKSIKALGKRSRLSIEQFLEKRVHLELFVKVREKWRDDERTLRHFGYQ